MSILERTVVFEGQEQTIDELRDLFLSHVTLGAADAVRARRCSSRETVTRAALLAERVGSVGQLLMVAAWIDLLEALASAGLSSSRDVPRGGGAQLRGLIDAANFRGPPRWCASGVSLWGAPTRPVAAALPAIVRGQPRSAVRRRAHRRR